MAVIKNEVAITLLPHAEKVAPPDAIAAYRGKKTLLYHQVRTYEAMEQAPLVMNTYPTGTGKTVAALLRLLHPNQHRRDTLFIAPTNALIDQHAEDIRLFCEENQLDVAIVKANAKALQALDPQEHRRGKILTQVIQNPTAFAQQLGIPEDEKRPLVMVTNPDIFSLALSFHYGKTDQRNVFQSFIQRFRYVVIDEFHYYDNKQFANFLFFFQLWKLWGYFETNTICLLSATPRQAIYTYLNRVFGDGGWVRIAPENEPPESANLPTIPTLTRLHLHIVEGEIDEWVRSNGNVVHDWHTNGLDAAIISSALWRINQIHHQLRSLDPVRITGPASADERKRIGPLVLATPTVDIGYNFGRPHKLGQSIDRLVCDARYGDELTQRIGRVGRVLNRAQTTVDSEATVVLNTDAMDELRQYDGQTFSRLEWGEVVGQLQYLPPKHQINSYIAVYAMREAFYPIYQLWKLNASEHRDEKIQELFTAIREVFAPNTKSKAWQFIETFRLYEKRKNWLAKPASQRWSPANKWERNDLAQHIGDYLGWLQSCKGNEVRYKVSQILPKLDEMLNRYGKAWKDQILAFIQSQVAITKAMFSFREAWQGPAIAIADPLHLLSNEPYLAYDALHIVANYTYRILKKADYQGNLEDTYPLYVELTGFRSPRLSLHFEYPCSVSQDVFEDRFCHQVVALNGLRLIAREIGLSGATIPLDPNIFGLIEKDWIPCLIVREQDRGYVIARLRGTSWYTRELCVQFDSTERVYYVVVGTAALHVHAAMIGYFHQIGRSSTDDCIII